MYRTIITFKSKTDGKRHQKTARFSSGHDAKSHAGKALKFYASSVKVTDSEGRVWFQGCKSKGVTINEKSID